MIGIIEGFIIVIIVTFLGMFFVLYTGDSIYKPSGKTFKQIIDDWLRGSTPTARADT